MQKSPVSIITINKDNAGGLRKTLESLVQQSYQAFELIVIDGASADESLDVIKAYGHRITHLVSEQDAGIYDAQNKGILKASGDYLLFLNSGDRLLDNDVLAHVCPVLSGGRCFYYGDLIIDQNGLQTLHTARADIDPDYLLNYTIWHPSVFIRSDLFRTYGLYNTDFRIAGDYEFFVRCLIKPDITTEYLRRVISVFDGSGISNSEAGRKLLAVEREKAWQLNISASLYRALKDHNRIFRSRYWPLIRWIDKLRGR